MSPALNGNSMLERFERSTAIKIRNGIKFNFYPGLPHIGYGKQKLAWSVDQLEMAVCIRLQLHNTEDESRDATQNLHSEKRRVISKEQVVHTWSMACELSSQIQLPQTSGRRNGNADGQFVTFPSA